MCPWTPSGVYTAVMVFQSLFTVNESSQDTTALKRYYYYYYNF